jgi:hypothetical protein
MIGELEEASVSFPYSHQHIPLVSGVGESPIIWGFLGQAPKPLEVSQSSDKHTALVVAKDGTWWRLARRRSYS